MTPMFYLSLDGDMPMPCFDKDADGNERVPDDLHYFDLEGAAKVSGLRREVLERAYMNWLLDVLGEIRPTDQTQEASDQSTEEEGLPDEQTLPRFVPIEDETRDPSLTSIVDLKDLSELDANQVRERVRQRMAGIPPELYAEFKEQADAAGYDILRRECYPVVQWNSDTKKNEVFCCATLDVVERKMLASGVCDGWVGPTLYSGKDGELKSMWFDEEPPSICQVTLRRKGIAEPTTVILDFNEAAQFLSDASGKKKTRSLTQFWRERPKVALEKCAKMKAMRTLFRDFVGAVYAREELPELSSRQLGAVERSTTSAGFRNRALPSFGSTSRAESESDTATLDIETIRTEVDFRMVLRSRGIMQDFMVEKVLEQARREKGAIEDVNPEAFWQYAFDIAVRRFGVRR